MSAGFIRMRYVAPLVLCACPRFGAFWRHAHFQSCLNHPVQRAHRSTAPFRLRVVR